MVSLAYRSVLAALILFVTTLPAFSESASGAAASLKDSNVQPIESPQLETQQESIPRKLITQEPAPQDTSGLGKTASSAIAVPTVRPKVGSGVITTDPTMVVVGLLLVIVFIVGSAWLMRRVGGLKILGGQSMSVVAALSVGTREKVVLIDVEGQQLLLGVAPGRVSHLKTFDESVVDIKRPKGNDFSSTIKKLLTENNANNRSSEKELNK